jgi:hypothetical protein
VFVNITESSGILDVGNLTPWQSVMYDFNGDGWLDIFSAVDFLPNHLWINQQDGTFVDMAESAGVNYAFNDMGVTLGDCDNDGDIDIYVTEIYDAVFFHNILLRNDSFDGNLLFTEVSEQAGVNNTGFGWGTSFMDGDNDGNLDLAVTNGWFNGIGFQDSSRFFLNNGDDPVTFSNVSDEVGFNDIFWGSCLVSGDLDRDGDLDLAQACNLDGPFRVLMNNQTGSVDDNNWLVIQPRQADKNFWSIGAQVTLTVGDQTMSRVVTAGTSHLGQEAAESFFGVGTAEVVDRVEVRWPLGDITVWEDVAVNQIFKAIDADLNVDGQVTIADVAAAVHFFGPCNGQPCIADIDHNDRVDIRDLVLIRSVYTPLE